MPKKDKNGTIVYNAESRSDYLSFISEFPRAGMPVPGGVYTMRYNYLKNPDFKSIPLAKKWFYTKVPLILCFYVSQKKKLWYGISVTNLPVQVRQRIISHLRKTQAEAFSEKRKKLRFRQFLQLMRLFKKISCAYRCYKWSRGTDLRAVPPDEVENLIKFTATFLHQGNYSMLVNRYRSYRPPVK